MSERLLIANACLSTDHPSGSPLTGGSNQKPSGPSKDRRIMMLATTITGSVLTGLLLGWFLDRHFDTAPRFTVGLSFLFLVSGMYQLIKEASR